MPLVHGDIEVFSITTRTIKQNNGKLIEAKEIRFRVRGDMEDTLYIPLDEFSKATAEQAILRAAADLIDILDTFPVKG